MQVVTRGKAFADPTILRSSNKRGSIIAGEVYPIPRHSRAKQNELAVKPRERERTRILSGKLRCAVYSFVAESTTNQSLTANGNEARRVPRINSKRVGQDNRADVAMTRFRLLAWDANARLACQRKMVLLIA